MRTSLSRGESFGLVSDLLFLSLESLTLDFSDDNDCEPLDSSDFPPPRPSYFFAVVVSDLRP